MEKIKKWILILFVIIIILIILILCLNIISPQNNNIEDDFTIAKPEESYILEENVTLEKNYNTFFTVEKNIQNFNLYLKVKNKKAVYELLSKEMIQNNGINEENVLDYVYSLNVNNYEFRLKELYVSESYIYPEYYAKGEIIQRNQINTLYYLIQVDQNKMTWEIEPILKQRYEEYIKSKAQSKNKVIEETTYNKFKITTVNDEDIAKKYFRNLIYDLLHNTQETYNMLENEYKIKRFSTLENFQNFINEKSSNLLSMDMYSIKHLEEFENEELYNEYLRNLKQVGLNKYHIKKYTNYTQYVCIDDYNNCYIFNETSPMNYTVLLDTYTVDLPEFIEKYNNSTTEEKILLNIQKCFEAINNKDYNYVYNKLDETFKANNFGSIERFEEYIKNNFFEQNEVTASNPQKQDDIYLYDITIKNALNATQKNKTFVMKLKEGTDFVMSFNIE